MSPVLAELPAPIADKLRDARILLTGASGFVGQQVARLAISAGLDLHTVGRHPGPPGVRHHLADLADRTATRDAVATIAPQIILNLASPGVAFGTADYHEMLTTLVVGAEALLSAAGDLPDRPHVVHVGTGFEYTAQDRPIREDDPVVPSATRYGAAKAAASAVMGGFAGLLPVTILRPFNIYGAGDTAPRLGSLIMTKALAGEAIEVTAGAQMRDFLHIDDFARLLWQVAAEPEPDHGFAVYNAGSAAPLPLRDYIATIGEALHRRGIDADIQFGAIAYRPGEPMIAVPDLTRLHARFDWRPRVDFAVGVDDYVEWNLDRCR